MPYVVGVESSTDAAPGTAFSLAVPAGHQANDLALAFVNQDTGTATAITNSSGWTELTTQAAANAQRLAVFYKVVASSSEPDLVLAGHNENWCGTVVLIRGASPTTPINASARANVLSGSTSSSWTPGVTTTAANCLVLHAWSHDGNSARIRPLQTGTVDFVSSYAGSATAIHIGSRAQIAAGTNPPIEVASSAQGSAVSIAINDDGSGAIAPWVGGEANEMFRQLGTWAATEGVTFQALSATGIGSILGVPLDTNVSTAAGASSQIYVYTTIGSSTATDGNPGLISGACFAVPSTDLTGKLLSLTSIFPAPATPIGPLGIIMTLQDSAGAWVAYQLHGQKHSATNLVRHHVFEIGGPGVLASGGGAIDWTDIVRIGFGMHRTYTTAVSRSFMVGNLFFATKVKLVGGSPALPVNMGHLVNAAEGWYGNMSVIQQGQRQALIRTGVQFGDGTTPTYADTTACSLETPEAYATTLPQYLWRVGNDKIEVRIKASASCTMRLGSTTYAAGTRQLFVIDPASSPSADYDFAGAAFVGWRVENNSAGIPINGAVFSQGYRITLNGGVLTGCTISGALESPAVLTNDPDNITGCEFIAGPAGGHAIEITAPGTYTLAGNSFAGYGADGTIDAAVYNNSGGAVTLNITGGGSTPTVRNGAGASTTVVSGATLTLTGLVSGSDIVILDAGTTIERVNVDSNAGSTYAYAYTVTGDVDIGVFKAGYVPLYVRGYTLTASSASLPISQAVDRGYLNPA